MWSFGPVVESPGGFFANEYYHASCCTNAFNLHTTFTVQNLFIVLFMVVSDTWSKSTQVITVQLEQLPRKHVSIRVICSNPKFFSEKLSALEKKNWLINETFPMTICRSKSPWQLFWGNMNQSFLLKSCESVFLLWYNHTSWKLRNTTCTKLFAIISFASPRTSCCSLYICYTFRLFICCCPVWSELQWKSHFWELWIWNYKGKHNITQKEKLSWNGLLS